MKAIKKYLSLALILGSFGMLKAQPTVYPAKSQEKAIAIQGATIHIGNGKVIDQGTLVFEGGKITYVGNGNTGIPAGAETIDATGKHLYPGFIAPNTNLGLVDITSVRATVDFAEMGDNNAHVRSLVAYNADSKVINTLRFNGVLLAQITPEGGLISGQSSVVQLDAWNWEDAAYKVDEGIHIQWPVVRFGRGGFGGGGQGGAGAQSDRVQKEIALLEDFLYEAKGYADLDKEETVNARLAAFKPVFKGERKLYVHADKAKDIIAAVSMLKRLGVKPVIVGGREAHLIITFLKDNDIAIIINQSHSLPASTDDDVYLPYKQGKILHDAGILVAYSVSGFWQQRNLPFMAGTAVGHGLDKEQALATITGNTAKILGIDDRTGTLEVGKDATLFISTGEALDMKGNILEAAFIIGKTIDLDNLHKQLFERYKHKYDLSAND